LLATRNNTAAGTIDFAQLWYVRVYFPTEAEANHFASVCSSAVEQIRERLYQLHQKAV